MRELPTMAVYLAEAEWRAGEEEAADLAADLALEAAREQGSNHVLLRALADLPAVVARRIDAEPGADSPWHDLGRALIAQGASLDVAVGTSLRLLEFGRMAIVVDGEEVRPRIVKCYELLSFLASRGGDPVDRDELLDALFEGQTDDTTRTYLRQALHHLRGVLPDAGSLVSDRRTVGLAEHVVVSSESLRLEVELSAAARLQGEERLTATLEALAVREHGEFLPGARSAWAEERRAHLAELVATARHEAAAAALAAGRYEEASRLTEQVLRADPLRESAWRLAMRTANALGDDDGVIGAFRSCERALAAIGTEPTASTRQLLESLRR